jgi:integrase
MTSWARQTMRGSTSCDRTALAGSARKGRRVIAIDPGTIDVLKRQAARQLEEQEEWDDAWIDSGLVFTLENGQALDPESVSRYWRLAVKNSMLPQIRLHDLRHAHATLALQAGIHPKVVSERLGHATISITLGPYSHAIPAMQEEAAALIAGLVFAETAASGSV